MKLILILLITIVAVKGFALDLFMNDSPARLAGFYYSSIGIEAGYSIPEAKFSNSPQYGISLYAFRPSRQGLSFIAKSGYREIDNHLYASLAGSKRYYSYLYGGAEAETAYDFDKQELHLTATGSVLYKFTGNYEFGVDNKTKLSSRDGSHFKNMLSLTGGLNINRDNRVRLSLYSKPDIRFSWQTGFNNFKAETGLKTENLFSSNSRVNFFISFGYRSGSSSLRSSIDKTKDYRQLFAYTNTFGVYTPPIIFEPTIFSVKKDFRVDQGLTLLRMIDRPPAADIIINVKRGDSLHRISRNLPAAVEDSYRENIAAIASYNNIRSPYVIHPGQQLRIPPKIISEESLYLVDLTDEEEKQIREAIFISRTSDLIEVRINAAIWSYLLDGYTGMMEILPVRADIDNKFLLNTQAIPELELRNPKSAIRKLKFALTADQDCPVLNTNLALAYYLDNRLDEARVYFLKGRDSANRAGLDTALHNAILGKLDVK